VILSVLDRKWREHLYEMDYLRDGIGLRAMAQRDPLIEYQREGYELFNAMMEAIKEETAGYLFNVQVEVAAPAAITPESAAATAMSADASALAAAARLISAQRGEAPAAPAAARAGGESAPATQAAPRIMAKGLAPQRPATVEYSGPTEAGGVEHHTGSVDGEEVVVDPNASRAERRRQERAARRKR